MNLSADFRYPVQNRNRTEFDTGTGVVLQPADYRSNEVLAVISGHRQCHGILKADSCSIIRRDICWGVNGL